MRQPLLSGNLSRGFIQRKATGIIAPTIAGINTLALIESLKCKISSKTRNDSNQVLIIFLAAIMYFFIFYLLTSLQDVESQSSPIGEYGE